MDTGFFFIFFSPTDTTPHGTETTRDGRTDRKAESERVPGPGETRRRRRHSFTFPAVAGNHNGVFLVWKRLVRIRIRVTWTFDDAVLPAGTRAARSRIITTVPRRLERNPFEVFTSFRFLFYLFFLFFFVFFSFRAEKKCTTWRREEKFRHVAPRRRITWYVITGYTSSRRLVLIVVAVTVQCLIARVIPSTARDTIAPSRCSRYG